MTYDDAIRCLRQIIEFAETRKGYEEFIDDLYSLLDAFEEDKVK